MIFPGMEYYSTIKRNDILINAMTWMILVNVVDKWKKSATKTTHHGLIYVKCPQIKLMETECRMLLSGYGGGPGEGLSCVWGFFLECWKCFKSTIESGDDYMALYNLLKITEPRTLNRSILW